MSAKMMESKSDGAPTKQQLLEKGQAAAAATEDMEDEPDHALAHKGVFKNINLFVLNLALLNIARAAMRVYLGGSIRTIERRFGLRSASTGLIFGLLDVGHIALVLFLGYFARTAHKPRLIGIISVFPAVAAFLMASPYFVLPDLSGSTLPIGTAILDENATATLPIFGRPTAQMCDGTLREEDCELEMEQAAQNTQAYALFVLASLLGGIGGPATMVLGVPYVDENTSATKTAFYVGVITSSFALGPVVGLVLASVCTHLPENLEAADMEPTNPNFIGAWWLGFLLLGASIILLDLPMFFYPRTMATKDAGIELQELAADHKMGRRSCKSIWDTLRAIPSTVTSLLRNSAFVTLLLSEFFGAFMVIGVFMNVPRYLEAHFLMPAYRANMVAALCTATMGLLGGFLGGIVVSRLRLQLLGLAKMLLISSGTVLICVFVIMFIRCPKVQMDGQWNLEQDSFSVATQCNQNCSCLANKKTYQPVCGDNDLTYFSPCHAGCSQHANGSFHDCSCMEPGVAVEPGLCLRMCSMIVPYAITLGIMSLIGNGGRPAQIVATMRVVPEEDRSLGLGINSFVVNLFGLLPGPIIFGYLIDTSCDLWQTICGESGSCLLYDTDKFRLRTYGTSLGFMAANFLLVIMFAFIIKHRKQHQAVSVDSLNGKGHA